MSTICISGVVTLPAAHCTVNIPQALALVVSLGLDLPTVPRVPAKVVAKCHVL